jgi:hypothetical protein
MMNIFRFFLLLTLSVGVQASAADQEDKIGQFYRNFKAKLQAEAKGMDKKFFKKVFPKESIPALFEQVLEEEHALLPQTVISKKVRQLSNFPGASFVELDKKIDLIQDLSNKNYKNFETSSANPEAIWRTLLNMNEPFRSFNEEQQMEILMFWRELFRKKVQDHVAYLAGIQPWYSVSLSSFSEYDTNVNRAPDDTAALDFSGKDDFQQTFLLNFDWKPLDNNKKFSENWTFVNKFQGVYLGQSAHKENTMSVLNVEPKLTRNLNGWLKSASLAYRYHNFYFDLNTAAADPDNAYNTRQVEHYFSSHRVKLELMSKSYGAYKFINGQNTKFSLSYDFKSHADDSLNSLDAQNMVLNLSQTFLYSSRNDSITFGIEYSDYETDAFVFGDFNYWKPSISGMQKFELGWDYPFTFVENLSYRHKNWQDYVGGEKTEQLTTLSLTTMTNLREELLVMIRLSQAFMHDEVDSTPPLGSNANQFKAMLGFTWMQ